MQKIHFYYTYFFIILFFISACQSLPNLEAKKHFPWPIYNAKSERQEYSQLIEALNKADLIILGEVHDNPHHHKIQKTIVDLIKPHGLAFEMVPEAQEAEVNYARANNISAEDLGTMLDWESRGWPAWQMYQGIFRAAPRAYIAGGGVKKNALRKAMAEGAASADPQAQRFGLAESFTDAIVNRLTNQLVGSHCNAIDKNIAAKMLEAQRLRDANFARALLRAAKQGGGNSILITGNGHAKNNSGVPWYIQKAAPGTKVVSIGLVESRFENSDNAPDKMSQFDYTILTDPVDREDPCIKYLQHK